MDPTTTLEEVLCKMLDEAPKNAIAAQLQIRGGIYSGAVRRSPDYPGLYELGTPGRNQQTNKISIINVLFSGEHIDAIILESDQEAPVIHVPNGPGGGMNIPGMG